MRLGRRDRLARDQGRDEDVVGAAGADRRPITPPPDRLIVDPVKLDYLRYVSMSLHNALTDCIHVPAPVVQLAQVRARKSRS